MAKEKKPQKLSSKAVTKGLFSPAFLFAVVCCSVLAFAVTWTSNSPRQLSPGLGKPGPQIDLIKFAGNHDVTSADVTLEGRVTLLHFWGTWCGACRMEYPELAKATKALSDQADFQFVPISCEGSSRETFEGLWEKTSEFFQSEGIESETFADPRGVTRRSLANRLDQEALYYPTSVLIGPDGKIAGIWDGYSKSGVAQMTAMVQSLSDSR